jgi:molybdopterin molybdotransferase
MGGATVLGLPGNPVSSYVCGVLFLVPLLAAAQGLPFKRTRLSTAKLAADLPRNGPREHYMRAKTHPDGTVEAAKTQDSSLMRLLAHSDVLIQRPPHDPARSAGEWVAILEL